MTTPTRTRIGFSTTDGVLSRTIRALTKSEVSHCFFLYWDHDWFLDVVMEADTSGFRVVPFERFNRDNRVVDVITPAHDIEVGVCEVARRYMGTRYDVGGLVGMTAVLAGLGPNILQSRRQAFCSEAVAFALKHSGHPGTAGWDPSRWSPKALRTFLLANGVQRG